jgi:hypothetical protein
MGWKEQGESSSKERLKEWTREVHCKEKEQQEKMEER